MRHVAILVIINYLIGCSTPQSERAEVIEWNNKVANEQAEQMQNEREEQAIRDRELEAKRKKAFNLGTPKEQFIEAFGNPQRTNFYEGKTYLWYDDGTLPTFIIFNADDRLVGWLVDSQTIEIRKQAKTQQESLNQQEVELAQIRAEQNKQARANDINNLIGTINNMQNQNAIHNLSAQQRRQQCLTSNKSSTINMPCN